MLTAYRELKHVECDTTELDVHLEGCASCRQALARSMFVGERLRALPAIEPPLEIREQLMRRLAREHMQFMQKAAPGSAPVPDFLKPYIHEQAQSKLTSHAISAFSTAETGPLPILHAKRKPRHRSQMSQFAILGLAATILMLLMMGGVTSLVYLAQRNASTLARVTDKNADSVQHVEISQTKYTTATLYSHIVSAVANDDTIFDTAYSDTASPQWMLSQVDRTTQVSTPILGNPYNQPMIVLASSPDWLVWVQYGVPKSESYRGVLGKSLHTIVTPWSLYAYSLPQLKASNGLALPELLAKGQFNPTTAPAWAYTPVQGVWLSRYTLLVASVDAKGNSTLMSYQMNLAGKPAVTTIDMATLGHLLTSPTANSDATTIFWSDEWISNAGILSSDIVEQQEVVAPGASMPTHGRWSGHIAIVQQQTPFRADGQSFSPQVADGTLLWLGTAPLTPASQGTTVSGTPTIVTTPQTSSSIIPRTDTNFSASPLDASIEGQVMMQPLSDDGLTPPVSINSTGPAHALQVGSGFALWQNDKGYEMWDVPTQSDVSIGHVLDTAAFLAVNGGSAVWTETQTTSTATPTGSGGTLPGVQIFTFNWPK